jgi:S1-C subfamily serine protease
MADGANGGSPWWWGDRDGGEEPTQRFQDAATGGDTEPSRALPPAGVSRSRGFYQGGDGWADPWGRRPKQQSWSEPPAAGYYGQPEFGQPPPRRPDRSWVIAAAVAGLLIAGVAGGFATHALISSGRSTAASNSRTVPSSGGGPSSGPGSRSGSGAGNGLAPGSGGSSAGGSGTGPPDAAAIASRVDPGLVDINTIIDYGQAEAAGTGMVVSADGEVLTNNHVIEGATSISVTDVGNGQTYQATVVGYSVTSDVAVVQLSGAAGLQTVTTAAAATVTAGEQVVGIGNAGGTGGTPSYAGGAVTATDQSITASDTLTGTDEQLTGMLETNADIRAGDSGGPLVNASGQVIGMDTAGSQSFQFGSQAQGNGYAIPIGTASSIASQILADRSSGSVHVGPTAFLGVGVSHGNGGYGSTVAGVLITGVVAGSPAADAGLAAGDVITGIGGYAVTSPSALQNVLVVDLSPGQAVTVEYTDSAGQQQSLTLTLATGPAA